MPVRSITERDSLDPVIPRRVDIAARQPPFGRFKSPLTSHRRAQGFDDFAGKFILGSSCARYSTTTSRFQSWTFETTSRRIFSLSNFRLLLTHDKTDPVDHKDANGHAIICR